MPRPIGRLNLATALLALLGVLADTGVKLAHGLDHLREHEAAAHGPASDAMTGPQALTVADGTDELTVSSGDAASPHDALHLVRVATTSSPELSLAVVTRVLTAPSPVGLYRGLAPAPPLLARPPSADAPATSSRAPPIG